MKHNVQGNLDIFLLLKVNNNKLNNSLDNNNNNNIHYINNLTQPISITNNNNNNNNQSASSRNFKSIKIASSVTPQYNKIATNTVVAALNNNINNSNNNNTTRPSNCPVLPVREEGIMLDDSVSGDFPGCKKIKITNTLEKAFCTGCHTMKVICENNILLVNGIFRKRCKICSERNEKTKVSSWSKEKL